MTREQMCGQWDVQRDQRLSMAGRDKNIVGYCYEDRSDNIYNNYNIYKRDYRSGHSCETRNILVDVAIEHNSSLSDQFPGLR